MFSKHYVDSFWSDVLKNLRLADYDKDKEKIPLEELEIAVNDSHGNYVKITDSEANLKRLRATV